jgi:hypothetical protein
MAPELKKHEIVELFCEGGIWVALDGLMGDVLIKKCEHVLVIRKNRKTILPGLGGNKTEGFGTEYDTNKSPSSGFITFSEMVTPKKWPFLLIFILHLCGTAKAQIKPIPAFESGRTDSVAILNIHPTGGLFRCYYQDRIYFLNDRNGSLDYFDLTKKTHETVFKVGEKLLNECEGIGVFHPDTITFLTRSGIRAFTADGYLAAEHRFKKEIPVTDVLNNEKLPLLRFGGCYIFPRMSRKWHMVYRHDPQTGKSVFMPIQIDYLKKRRFGVLFGMSMSHNGERLGVLFQFGPEVHLAEADLKTIQKKRTESLFYTPLWEMENRGDEKEFLRHWITNGTFNALTYDPYRKKWLAAYAHPQPYLDKEGNPNQIYYRTFSVIVMSENFEPENEFVFGPETTWIPYFTVTERGLVLQKKKHAESPYTEFYLLRYFD